MREFISVFCVIIFSAVVCSASDVKVSPAQGPAVKSTSSVTPVAKTNWSKIKDLFL